MYLVNTPWLLKKLYPQCIWNIPTQEKVIYLTFDDGPHPTITPFVLDCLKQYNAKATFFCIGKNVVANADTYRMVLDHGHKVGNHTHNHLNGWKVKDADYFKNIYEATQYIDSNLFRPPYGRITQFQAKHLSKISPYQNKQDNFRLIMWSVLSGDFDIKISGKEATLNVINNAKEGSIVVFHDSEKAFPRLKESLPQTLEYFSKKGYRFDSINLQ